MQHLNLSLTAKSSIDSLSVWIINFYYVHDLIVCVFIFHCKCHIYHHLIDAHLYKFFNSTFKPKYRHSIWQKSCNRRGYGELGNILSINYNRSSTTCVQNCGCLTQYKERMLECRNLMYLFMTIHHLTYFSILTSLYANNTLSIHFDLPFNNILIMCSNPQCQEQKLF